MERHHNRGHLPANSRNHKFNTVTSRHKKDQRLGSKSSKNIKVIGSKGNIGVGEPRELGITSPIK